MSSHFSSESLIREMSDTCVRPCDHNVPGKIGETSPFGYTHGKVGN